MSVHSRSSLCVPNSLNDKPALVTWQRPCGEERAEEGRAEEGRAGPSAF